FSDEDGFACVAGSDEIREKECNLSIPLYVRVANGNGSVSENRIEYGEDSLKKAISEWDKSSSELRESMDRLFDML
ncbi:MAG: SAM-dependent DNA methyltransferase, partial [Acidobacteriota bacterium]